MSGIFLKCDLNLKVMLAPPIRDIFIIVLLVLVFCWAFLIVAKVVKNVLKVSGSLKKLAYDPVTAALIELGCGHADLGRRVDMVLHDVF